MNLVERIDNFINKQIKFRSQAEAEKYGVKIPKGKLGPKLPEYKPKAPRQPKTTFPRSYRPRQAEARLPGVAGEVAHQLAPLGPYRSVEDIAQDVKEAERLARKITGIKKLGLKEGKE